jgi:hypothetical protein
MFIITNIFVLITEKRTYLRHQIVKKLFIILYIFISYMILNIIMCAAATRFLEKRNCLFPDSLEHHQETRLSDLWWRNWTFLLLTRSTATSEASPPQTPSAACHPGPLRWLAPSAGQWEHLFPAIARWYHSGLLRGRGPKKFVKKVSRNDVGVITNELGPFKITLWYHSLLLRGRGPKKFVKMVSGKKPSA